MRRKIACFIVFLILITLWVPGLASAAPERRIALVIGNGSYETGPLKNPANDATDMAATLRSLGFEVILKKNVRYQEMEEAVENFGKRLRQGGVGLFFYAGHGVQVAGVNYLIPIGARINKESDVKHQALSAEKVLDEMAEANNGLNIVLLDACRDNPYARSMRSASRGLAIISSAPEGTFISFATGPGQTAGDGDGRNSPYTAALLRNISRPGLPIERVFKGVRSELSQFKQTPWELSSLKGEFYFSLGIATEVPPSVISPVIDEQAQRSKLAEEKELIRKREAFEEDRRKLDEEKKQLALTRPPAPPAGKEIARDGRFVAYDNGTVIDIGASLMWAAEDNGKDINWRGAKIYCESYRGGGYTDWRMPTLDELEGLYDPNNKNRHGIKVSKLIQITNVWVWASETEGNISAFFAFRWGERVWRKSTDSSSLVGGLRAIPVRSIK